MREADDLCEALRAGQTAADNGKREQAVAMARALGQRGRLVEVSDERVADVGCLLRGLEANRLVRDARRRERAGHATQRDDEHVVGNSPLLARLAAHVDLFVGVADALDLGRDDVGLGEVLRERDLHMARLDGARRHFRQKRLVDEVWSRLPHVVVNTCAA